MVCKIGNCSLLEIMQGMFIGDGELNSALNGGMLGGVIEAGAKCAGHMCLM